MCDPFVRVYRKVLSSIFRSELQLPVSNDASNYAPKHTVGSKFAHALPWTKSKTPHIVSQLNDGNQ